VHSAGQRIIIALAPAAFTFAPHLQTINQAGDFRRPVAFDPFWQPLIKVDGTFA
jgi:hypothetical protein